MLTVLFIQRKKSPSPKTCVKSIKGNLSIGHCDYIMKDITCSSQQRIKFNVSCKINKFESIRVEWTKESQLVLTGTSSNLSLKSTDRFSQVIRETEAILTIKNIHLNDTGLYLCNVIVELPILLKVNGNGTKLTVQGISEEDWTTC
uniref:Ig-like domain-containing protein n=1 Tax=Callorhinchus milii TaxID=7868 RepID=A0A4W3GES5_CALMI